VAKEYEYLDDYAVGDTFVSPARTITEADIVNFAGITGDWHPMHTDAEYAAKTPFRKNRPRHAHPEHRHGAAFQARPSLELPAKSFKAFYGMDNVRFTAPTKIGDTIHCEVEVTEITDKG